MLKLTFVVMMVFGSAHAFADSTPMSENEGVTEAKNSKDPNDCPKCKAALAAEGKLTDPPYEQQNATMDTVVKTTGTSVKGGAGATEVKK